MPSLHAQPSGCLLAILRFFGINIGSDAKKKRTVELPFPLRDDFLSPTELSFCRVLEQLVGRSLRVCPKVNLGDLFFVVRPNEHPGFRNKIDRKHVDFLLCDPNTFTPRLGIELDDASHARRDRQERDAFVDALCAAATLPLLHIRAQASYDARQLLQEIRRHLLTDADPPGRPRPEGEVPLCPKCAVPMVRRTAIKGAHEGAQFWGCPSYPRCREVVRL